MCDNSCIKRRNTAEVIAMRRERWSTIARVLPFWAYNCAQCRNNNEHDFDNSKAYNCAREIECDVEKLFVTNFSYFVINFYI